MSPLEKAGSLFFYTVLLNITNFKHNLFIFFFDFKEMLFTVSFLEIVFNVGARFLNLSINPYQKRRGFGCIPCTFTSIDSLQKILLKETK